MNNQHNPYNQVPPMGQPLMPPPMPPRGQWQRRAMNAIERVRDLYFPKWLTQYAIVVYILALMAVSFIYSAYAIPWYYFVSGIVGLMVFFLYGSSLSKNRSLYGIYKDAVFEKKIFVIAFVPRVLLTLLMYWVFLSNYGDAFGFENSDATYYDQLGDYVADLIGKGDFRFYDAISTWSGSDDIADMGYGIYVGFIYWITGKSIISVRLIKCIWSSLTVLLIYRLAKRNFGVQTARLTAIFCALWPNFWYYCSAHLKETEMVFLCVLFVEQADQMLQSRQWTVWKVVPVLLVGATLFGFRTPLAVVALLALLFSVVMSSQRVVSWGKRVMVGLLAVLLIGVTMGNRIEEESRQLIDKARSNQQQENMEWRGSREDGNAFAKYAGKSVFAPLIFTIPFPTMVRPYDGQDVQQLLNGGNFVKNILSFFTIFAMFLLLLSGKWREHLLPLSFMLGYLVVLTMSTFAQKYIERRLIWPRLNLVLSQRA